jgi:hypothetical protein
MRGMARRNAFSRFIDSPLGETLLFVLGVLLVIVGFIVAPLPGPGGIFFIAPGLALILKTSLWAKRHYARFKKFRVKIFGRHYTPGHWADLALRRRSALRRERVRKERERLEREQQALPGD